LTEHSYIDATEIVVTVKDGEVTLEGTVPDRDQKHYAEEVAEQINGVTDVINRLKIKKPHNTLVQNTSGKQ
jgi:osmotically-inducible protein OsmY